MSTFIQQYGAFLFGCLFGFNVCAGLFLCSERIDVQLSARRRDRSGKTESWLENVKP